MSVDVTLTMLGLTAFVCVAWTAIKRICEFGGAIDRVLTPTVLDRPWDDDAIENKEPQKTYHTSDGYHWCRVCDGAVKAIERKQYVCPQCDHTLMVVIGKTDR